jgi:hypothetical protein
MLLYEYGLPEASCKVCTIIHLSRKFNNSGYYSYPWTDATRALRVYPSYNHVYVTPELNESHTHCWESVQAQC